MAKKQVAVSLRKPPAEGHPASQAAFLQDAIEAVVDASTPAPPRSSTRRTRAATTTTHETSAVPRSPVSADAFVGATAVTAMERPGVTAYLPEALARRLAAFCIAHERSVDEVLAEAVANHLDRIRPPQSSSKQAKEPASLTGWLRDRVQAISDDLRSFVAIGASMLRNA